MNVKHILEKYDLTLAELSEVTGVNRSYLWELMVGRRQVTVDMEVRLKVGLRNLTRERVKAGRTATTMLLQDGIELVPVERKRARADAEKTMSNLQSLGAVVDE